jgi:MoxR-like ATPase
MRLSLGFPDIDAEKRILLSNNIHSTEPTAINDIISVETLISIQNSIQQIHASESIIEYIIALCRVSRGQNLTEKEDEIACKPLSPRAGKALLAAARSWAFIDNRDYLLPDDIKAVFYSVCEHRLELNITEHQQHSGSISERILDTVNVLNPLGV